MSKDPIEELKKHYIIEDPEAVRGFLQQHPDLMPVLREAPKQISRFFPLATDGGRKK